MRVMSTLSLNLTTRFVVVVDSSSRRRLVFVCEVRRLLTVLSRGLLMFPVKYESLCRVLACTMVWSLLTVQLLFVNVTVMLSAANLCTDMIGCEMSATIASKYSETALLS